MQQIEWRKICNDDYIEFGFVSSEKDDSVLYYLFNKAFKRGNSAEQAQTITGKNLPELKDKSKDYFEQLRFNI